MIGLWLGLFACGVGDSSRTSYQGGEIWAEMTSGEARVLTVHTQNDGSEKQFKLATFGAGEWPSVVDPGIRVRAGSDVVGVHLGKESFPLILSDPPLFCRHNGFVADADWPTADAVALDVLTGRHFEPSAHFDEELDGALSVACAGDAKLKSAVVRALLDPKLPVHPDYKVSCLGELAGADPTVRATLTAALSEGTEGTKKRAALGLKGVTDVHAERALAKRLREVPKPCEELTAECTRERFARLIPAWVLASVVTARASAEPATVELAIELTRDPDEGMQVYATRILAASDHAFATARLEQLAAGHCPGPLTAEQLKFTKFNEALSHRRPASCYARAALR